MDNPKINKVLLLYLFSTSTFFSALYNNSVRAVTTSFPKNGIHDTVKLRKTDLSANYVATEWILLAVAETFTTVFISHS